MTNENLHSILQELGEIMGIGPVTPDEDGVARLRLGCSMILDLQKFDELYLGTMLSAQELSGNSDAKFLHALLPAHSSSGRLLPGVFPTWNKTNGETLLMHMLSISNPTMTESAGAIEDLLEYADKWREGNAIETANKSGSDMI